MFFYDLFALHYTIFEIAHLENGILVILLKNTENKLLNLAKGAICLDQKLVIITDILKKDIEIE